MKARKGLAFVLAAALLGLLSACLPRPDEPVDWVRREDAVLVQMVDVGGLPQPEVADLLTVPVFTLYGDGTLIYIPPDERAQFPATYQTLLRAEIPEEAVQDLLEFIADKDFLDFNYEQPRFGSVYDAPTTYLYINSKQAANAVSAYALGFSLPEDAGNEWEQFRRLQEIKERLDAVDPDAAGGRVLGPYEPEEILLMVEPLDSRELPEQPPTWPVAAVDLSRLAPPGAGVVQKRFPTDEAMDLMAAIPPGSHIYRQGDRLYEAGYRPVLPFEEHFPEFDQPER